MNSPSKQRLLRLVPPTLRSPLKQALDSRTEGLVSPLSSTASVNRLSFCDEDLVYFDPADFSAELAFHPYLDSVPRSGAGEFDSSDTYNKIRAVSRWRRLTSRLSKVLQTQSKASAYLVPDSPVEPTAVPLRPISKPSSEATCCSSSTAAETLGRLSRSHTKRSTKAPTVTESLDRSSLLYDSDPFRVEPAFPVKDPDIKPSSSLLIEEETVDPNTIVPSPPNSCIATPASLSPSSAISSAGNPLRKSIRRLKTLTRNRLSTNQRPVSERKAIPDGPLGTDASTTAVASSVPPPRLPELSFDSTPLSLLVPIEPAPDTAVNPTERQENTSSAKPLISQDTHLPASNFPLIKWERTPSLVPSPSWLSRNVRDIELQYAAQKSLRDQPPSPEPLPILPRSLLPILSRRASLELDPPNRIIVDYCPESQTPPQSFSSTLVSPGHLSVPSSPLTPSLHRLSVFTYSRASDRRSIHSVLTVAFTPDQENAPTSTEQEPAKPRFLLLLHPVQSPPPQLLDVTPAPSPLSLKLPVSFDRSGTVPATPIEPQELYIPSKQALEDSNDTFQLPSHFKTVIRSIPRSITSTPIMDGSKPIETIDIGPEYDYSGYEWFKDPPPPRPEPAPQAPVGEPYIPPPDTVEQNELFDFALRSAPSVLYGRYKQYGQLGVLAWCSEFSELIDSLKNLGFEGNMFVSTRTQALKTCEEILKLNLDIQMQIIVMYLSSQVARLRRFLDTEKQFDDYPKPNFPLDYTQYSA
ncbi:hypothetical protein NM688_g3912 [Phlebia brevispora]|uniref:Uncharacterized protein n=1 Tax=Phlebia brevispora TaxID=194682 RepID=A0ACC1T4G9_9APHY|nr:hypothetical protein NM688_g3912 [Phlebia brevispora]